MVGGAFAGAAGVAGALGCTVAQLPWVLLAVGVGGLLVASIVSPEGYNEAMERVKSGASVAANTVGNVVGSVVGGLTSGLVSGIGLPVLLIGGVAAYFLLSRRKSNAEDEEDEYIDYDDNSNNSSQIYDSPNYFRPNRGYPISRDGAMYA